MNHHRLEPLHSLRIAAALAIALLLFHGAAQAQAVESANTPACGSSIAACGCRITTSGTYTVTADLSGAAGDCIAIKANNVVLNINDHSITGPGSGTSTGAGIHVLKSSSGAFIEGGGGPSNITASGWKYGLEVQGKNTISDWVNPNGNVVGIFLDGATGANINDFSADDNSVYGVWIRGGKGNQINCFGSRNNTGTGVYIGCHNDDTRGTGCRGVKPSSGNRIYDFNSEDNGDAGVVIDVGNKGNVLTDLTIVTNAGGVDSIDENPSCGTDRWMDSGFDHFGVTSQSCIS
jgi:hypothetical protein